MSMSMHFMGMEKDIQLHDSGDGDLIREGGHDLAPGSYWRATRDLIEPRYRGSKEMVVVIREAEVRLVKLINYADDAVHSVSLASNPMLPDSSGHTLLIGDFFDHFEPIDGDIHRAGEIAQVEYEIGMVKSRMMRLGEDPEYRAQALKALEARQADASTGDQHAAEQLPAEIVQTQFPSVAPTVTDLDFDQMGEISRVADTALTQANLLNSLIQEESGALTEQLTLLGRLHKEKAEAMLAAVSDTTRTVERIQKGIKTLMLYVGEGVTHETVLEGECAPAGTPMHVFQRLLFMDEESAIHALDGGLDFKGFDDFVKELQRNPALLHRLVPAERGLVAIRFRRHDKDYGDPLDNARFNEANTRCFLFYRDGLKATVIWSPMDTLSRLFPSNDEMDRPFRGVCGSRITVDDVRWSRSKSDNEDQERHYKRLIVLVAGLHHKGEVFTGLAVDGSTVTLLDGDAQQQVLRYVYDDERDRTLGGGYQPWKTYVHECSLSVRSGSLVVANWRDLISGSSNEFAPSCWSTGYYSSGRHPARVPVDDVSIAKVYRKKGELYVKIPVLRWNDDKPVGDAHLKLSEIEQRSGGFAYILCLDAVTLADLRYYMDSRSERVHYVEMIPLVSAAWDFLHQESAGESAWVEALVQDAREGGIEAYDAELYRAATRAVRTWRVSHNWSLPPDLAAAESSKARAIMRDQLWAALGNTTGLVRQCQDFAESQGAELLRAVKTGRGHLVAYLAPSPSQMEDRLGPHAWVKRVQIQPSREKDQPPTVVTDRWVTMPRRVGDELILSDSPKSEEFASMKPRYKGMSFTGVEKAVQAMKDNVGKAIAYSQLEGDSALSLEVQRAINAAWDLSKSRVVRPKNVYPVMAGYAEDKHENGAVVLCLEIDVLAFAYARGSDRIQRQVRRAIESIYAEPQSPLSALEGLDQAPWKLFAAYSDCFEAQTLCRSPCLRELATSTGLTTIKWANMEPICLNHFKPWPALKVDWMSTVLQDVLGWTRDSDAFNDFQTWLETGRAPDREDPHTGFAD